MSRVPVNGMTTCPMLFSLIVVSVNIDCDSSVNQYLTTNKVYIIDSIYAASHKEK